MNIRALFISCFGLGHLRPAPGTWGSLPPAVLAFLMLRDGVSHGTYLWTLGVVALVFGLACILFGVWTERYYREKDPSECVADETCAQCLPLMALAPAWFTQCVSMEWWRAALTVLAAFLLFRILDIIKPWPGRRLENLPYGWGVLADDLSSGLYAAAVIFGLSWWAGAGVSGA
ncbi:MAG: phosphatidylglycerophosphatase A [Phycisphaerales bacterium]